MPIKFNFCFCQQILEIITPIFDQEINVNEIPGARFHRNGMNFIDRDIQGAVNGNVFVNQPLFDSGKRVVVEINLKNIVLGKVKLECVQSVVLSVVNLFNFYWTFPIKFLACKMSTSSSENRSISSDSRCFK